MKYILSFISVTLIFMYFTTFASNNTTDKDLSNIIIETRGKTYDGWTLHTLFEKEIQNRSDGDTEKILSFYKKSLVYLNKLKESERLSAKQKGNIELFYPVMLYGKNKYQEIEHNTVKKITLGFSEEGRPIYAYYKGNPEKAFFGIFSNIHGGYEYGTYKTANYLLQELSKSSKTGWFIIPTINPDGLHLYKKSGEKQSFYLEGRGNTHKVDINRNFCTDNFRLTNYNKFGSKFLTGRYRCNSEAETRVVVEMLKKYNFHKAISLHSRGEIFYIPDGSIDDTRIHSLGKRLQLLLPNYLFDIDYTSSREREQKIYEYEIDEGGSLEYTGTMETYMYQKHNIPVIIIELAEHGLLEYGLKDIGDIF